MKKRKTLRAPLKQRMEVRKDTSTQATDRVDSEVGSYVSAFIEGLPEAVKLEKISLATPEEARSALAVIEDTLTRLNKQMANAKALQRLVQSQNR